MIPAFLSETPTLCRRTDSDGPVRRHRCRRRPQAQDRPRGRHRPRAEEGHLRRLHGPAHEADDQARRGEGRLQAPGAGAEDGAVGPGDGPKLLRAQQDGGAGGRRRGTKYCCLLSCQRYFMCCFCVCLFECALHNCSCRFSFVVGRPFAAAYACVCRTSERTRWALFFAVLHTFFHTYTRRSSGHADDNKSTWHDRRQWPRQTTP